MQNQIIILIITLLLAACQTMDKRNDLTLKLERIDPQTNKVQMVTEKVPCDKVGIIVMDVWDQHWCKSWTARDAAGNMCLTWTRETSIINMANRGAKLIILEDLIISVSGLGYNPGTKQTDP